MTVGACKSKMKKGLLRAVMATMVVGVTMAQATLSGYSVSPKCRICFFSLRMRRTL